MARGSLTDFLTVLEVISLNTILHGELASIFRICARCQDMASPSISGSVARYIFFAALASLRILSSTSPLPLRVIYLGSKSCSTSTPSWLFGRSLTWPLEATTLYLLPRNFPIVFALAGDSTITSISDIFLLTSVFAFMDRLFYCFSPIPSNPVNSSGRLLNYSRYFHLCQGGI